MDLLTVAGARRVFTYNEAVLDSFRRALEKLPWSTVTKDRGSGHLSMRNTFVHVLQLQDVWVNYVIPGNLSRWRAEGLKDPDRLKDWTEIRALQRKTWEGIERYLRKLTQRELRRKVHAPWMPGEYTVSDALYHVTLDQAHHVGELVALLWQDDIQPPETTWIKIRNRLGRRN
jgi:uncharacterized damage-inducible protein DinB